MALKRVIQGKVVKKAGDKTATVLVERKVVHPRYHKIVKRFKKYLVHDERNECVEGDFVRMQESRPLSKEKRWRLMGVVTREKTLVSEKAE